MHNKNTIAYIFFFLVGVFQSLAQSNFTEQVVGMWKAGNYSGVSAIAQQRLAENTNDLAGLLLKFECDLQALDISAATNTAAEILRVAPLVETPCFEEIKSWVTNDAQYMIDRLPSYPPDEYAADLVKAATITNNPLDCDFAIQALEEDGYFNGSAPTPTPSAPN